MAKTKPVAVTKEDQRRADLLRSALPRPVPAGWVSATRHAVRLNEFGKPGIFAKIFSNGYLKLVFMIMPNNVITISVSHLNGIDPLPEHIELVKTDFFSKKNAQSTLPLSGLVYFTFPS